MHTCLSFNIDFKSGFQFNHVMVIQDCDLLWPELYKCFIKYVKVRDLISDEIMQVYDML